MTKVPMNLPNRITIARIQAIPVVLALISALPEGPNWPAAVLFAAASASDFIDGMIARKRNLITDFGKFMDPIADKLLVLLPLMLLLPRGGALDLWAVMIMVAREIVVSGFRLVAASKRIVIAAEWSGKIKTVLQMFAVLFLLIASPIGWYLTWAAALLSLYSGVEILWRNRRVLEETA